MPDMFYTGQTDYIPQLNNLASAVTLLGSGVTYVFNPMNYGAAGNGVTNDAAAIQAAINAAALVTSEYGPPAVVDLSGKSYGVGSTLTVVAKPNVIIFNGKLNALGTLTSTQYVIQFGDGTTNNRSRAASIRNVFIECNFFCNGISWNGNTGGRNQFCTIHGFTNYGVRAWNNGGDTVWQGFRITKYWFSDTDRGLKAKRTGKGFSLEDADHVLSECIISYCQYPFYADSFWNGQVNNCHFYNGSVTDLVKITITGVANNGTGSIRVTAASTAGIVNGDLVIVPWLEGVSGTGSGVNGKPGVYTASNVTATTIDFVGCLFGGTFDTGTSPQLLLWAEEQASAYVTSSAKGLNFTSCYFDKGKVVVNHGATCNISGGNKFVTDSGESRIAIEMISNGVAAADLAGIVITANSFAVNPFRFLPLNGGTFATPLSCFISANGRDGGGRCTAFGQFGFDDGTLTKPSFYFAGALSAEGASDTVLVDSNTGLYHPAEDNIGVVTGGVEAIRVDQNQKVYIDKLVLRPNASVTPSLNGEIMFEATSNTQVKIKLKGSDGVVRSATLTLS